MEQQNQGQILANQTGQTLEVPIQLAVQAKILEFDKMIAEAKAQVANLETQKAQFIFDSNIKILQQQYQKIPYTVPQ
jgi:hypothetical protein